MSVLTNVIGRQPGPVSGRFGLSLAVPKAARSALGLLSYIVGAVLAGVVLLVAVATVPTLFGYHTYVVSSGSMEPALRTGSIAVTSPSKPIGLKVGDIIAYDPASASTRVLHRIVKIEEVDGERRFITQGDSNAAPDPTPVTLDGAGDRVVYSVPYAGYVVGFAQGWGGRFLLIGVPAVLLAFIMGRDARRQPAQRAEPDAEVRYPSAITASPGAPTGPTTSPEHTLRFGPAPRPVVIAQPRDFDPHRVPPLTFGRGQKAFADELPVFRPVRLTAEERHAA